MSNTSKVLNLNSHDVHVAAVPTPSAEIAAEPLRRVSKTTCAGMRQSVPELVTNLVTKSRRGKIGDGQVPEKSGGQGRD